MEINNAHLNMNARTKADRLAIPVCSECEIRVYIGEFGSAELDIWQKVGTRLQHGDFGKIATLSMSKAKDMENLARCLIAISNAIRVVDGAPKVAEIVSATCGDCF